MASRLSPKSVAVLRLIAAGSSYAQIVDGHPEISYLDIFAAAQEALELNEVPIDHRTVLDAIKAEFPKAYEPWTADDDEELLAMYEAGDPIEDMARKFQRRPSAVEARLAKLGVR